MSIDDPSPNSLTWRVCPKQHFLLTLHNVRIIINMTIKDMANEMESARMSLSVNERKRKENMKMNVSQTYI